MVSLFLLLLVFFIVLTSIAQVRRSRAIEVFDSVDAAFGHMPSNLGLWERPAPDLPDLASAEGFARAVSGLITGFAPLKDAGHVAPGDNLLEVDLPIDAVFIDGGAALQQDAAGTLGRLAVLMQRHTGGERFHVTIRAILPPDSPSGNSPGEAMAMNRLGTLAAALYAQGCPADGLAIGVDHGPVAGLRLEFSRLVLPAEAD